MENPKYLDEAFAEVGKELTELFIRKYKDYGKGNIIDTGELGIAFRISDKLNRLKHLLMKAWMTEWSYPVCAYGAEKKVFHDDVGHCHSEIPSGLLCSHNGICIYQWIFHREFCRQRLQFQGLKNL